MPPLQPTRPWKPDLANIIRRPNTAELDDGAERERERRTDHWRARQMDSQDTGRLHIGEYYSIQIDLNNLDIYNRSIGIDESSPQWLTDLVPKRSSYKEVLLLDQLAGKLYKFQVNPIGSTPAGVIMVPGYPSILLATRIANPLRKLLMRDRQTREKRGRTLYDEKDGPKKLRTIR